MISLVPVPLPGSGLAALHALPKTTTEHSNPAREAQ
jgi:hypothetical protein